MTDAHYFTPEPSDDLELRTIRVPLVGTEYELVTANSVFSGQHLDRGTRILLDEVPEPPAMDHALDLGCGWGPIALSLALHSSELTVWALDVNERALALTEENAKRLDLANVRAVRAPDVPADIEFDAIWSNPPIRIGKGALHELLDAWIPRLAPGGTAWLVVAKNLGADSLQRWLAEQYPSFSVARHSTTGGFRVLRVTRPEG